MTKIYTSADQLIGKTPLLELTHVEKELGLEAKLVAETCGSGFVTVTPGIRFASDAKGDQKRVTTPAMAYALGSSFIVVGRSITGAEDPVAAYHRAKREFSEGM